MGVRKYQLGRHWSEEEACRIVGEGEIKPTSLEFGFVEEQRCPLRGTNLWLLSQSSRCLEDGSSLCCAHTRSTTLSLIQCMIHHKGWLDQGQ